MTKTRTLYLIGCAAPPARHLDVPIRAAQQAGWDVCLILTPSAHRWLTEDAEGEIQALEELTDHPAVQEHVDFLREAGVTVLLGEGGFTPHKPKQSDLNAYPWQVALEALPPGRLTSLTPSPRPAAPVRRGAVQG
ncbi:hypothetical protein ACH4D5_21095 [Streptomyces sp. NPDC018029]|uniref:hypothetical protein n=1 Tax=Streptomyces sp. NPDC018029 TaxID=3365032 RepID=UPI0037A083B2